MMPSAGKGKQIMVRNIALRSALAAVLGVLLYTGGTYTPPTANALGAETQVYQVVGDSTAASTWNYRLQSCTVAGPVCVVVIDKSVGPLAALPCSDPLGSVKKWVDKINGEPPPAGGNFGFDAAVVGPAADCKFSITFPNRFKLSILAPDPSCQVTNNILGCTFNPTITQIGSVGGVAEAPDVDTLSTAASASGGIDYAPYAGGGAAAVVLLAAGVAGAWYLRRRQQA